ncbi:hypothetical protein V5799_020388 [Amblyomma americanum]|uniref:DNA topoisomerase (ATP-hydrolyzing) n=1 Tax=Amblyomma americanum TaxID=6943 RepID=A0AAQ4EU56_AMBAM
MEATVGEGADEDKDKESVSKPEDIKQVYYLLGLPPCSLTPERKDELLEKEEKREKQVVQREEPLEKFWNVDTEAFSVKSEMDQVERNEETVANASKSSKRERAKMLECGVKSGMSWVTFKAEKRLGQKRSAKKKSKLKFITILEDANDAGTRNTLDCSLILTDGNSAKSLAVSRLSQYKANYISVDNLKSLRYGRLMIMTAQDQEGVTYQGTPDKLHPPQLAFAAVLVLPTGVRGVESSEQLAALESEVLKRSGHQTPQEAKEYLMDMLRARITFHYHGNEVDYAIQLFFSKMAIEEERTDLSAA